MFADDGSLLVCNEKSDRMNIKEDITVEQEGDDDTSEEMLTILTLKFTQSCFDDRRRYDEVRIIFDYYCLIILFQK